MRNFVMTSESVTSGHPDKLCDQISDAVVDAYLSHGVRTGIIAECALATGVVFLSIRAGEDAPVDAAALARRVYGEAGYDLSAPGATPTVMLDYAPMATSGVRASSMVSAFGYAAPQTPSDMPYPIWAAHQITAALDRMRKTGDLPWIAPDAQVQLAVEFADRTPRAIRAIAVICGLTEPIDAEEIRATLFDAVVTPALDGGPLRPAPETRFIAHAHPGPSGPPVHSGLTGRKSADDAYGSFIRRSGPALSGKDPSRADRIAAYAARQAARAAVRAGLARECEVQLSYIAGDLAPASVEVDSYGSGQVADAAISRRLAEVIDFRIDAIIERMGLWDLPGARDGRFYRDLATYGHMGRDALAPPWEDMAIAAEL